MTTPELDTLELKRHLLAGGVCVFPTDTVVGIGCLAYLPNENSCEDLGNAFVPNFAAVEKIFRVKNRSAEKKLPWLVGDSCWLQRFGRGDLSSAEKLAAKCWPGATTIIVKAAESLDEDFTVQVAESKASECTNFSTLALRMPACKFLLDVLAEINLPIACTSANVSGEPAVASVAEVSAKILNTADFLFAFSSENMATSEKVSTKNPSGVASQIFDCTCAKPKQLR